MNKVFRDFLKKRALVQFNVVTKWLIFSQQSLRAREFDPSLVARGISKALAANFRTKMGNLLSAANSLPRMARAQEPKHGGQRRKVHGRTFCLSKPRATKFFPQANSLTMRSSAHEKPFLKMPRATAGTVLVVQWGRIKLCISQYISRTLCKWVFSFA